MINEKDLEDIINDVTWSYEECGIEVPQNILDTLNEIKQIFKNQPTFDECIKMWEDRGFEVKENTDHNLLFRHHKEDNVVEIFKRGLSYMYYPYFDDGTILSIPYELHNLIHKTLKALENNNETK
jgi:hypothetical protein